jgi:hypothetical protein
MPKVCAEERRKKKEERRISINSMYLARIAKYNYIIIGNIMYIS